MHCQTKHKIWEFKCLFKPVLTGHESPLCSVETEGRRNVFKTVNEKPKRKKSLAKTMKRCDDNSEVDIKVWLWKCRQNLFVLTTNLVAKFCEKNLVKSKFFVRKNTFAKSRHLNDKIHKIRWNVTFCISYQRSNNNNNNTYLLTPWCRVLLEKITGLQLVKKFPGFHRTRRFITALTSVRHLSLSWASPIQSIYPHPTSWRSILILSTHLRLGLPSGLCPSCFPTKTLYTPCPHP